MNSLLVAIPVWPGDYDRVLANLRSQFERDGKVAHNALLSFDDRITHAQASVLKAEAQKCFAWAGLSRYGALREPRPWPHPHNYAWKQTARAIEDFHDNQKLPGKARGWFLWESDALPLKKGWIDVLADAYAKEGKPFFGHIVPGRGHMNAVAVYPMNVAHYCTKAMLVKQAPFDVVLSQEVGERKIGAANAYIAHHLKVRGGDPARPITPAILKTLPETTVIIHGYYEPGPTYAKELKEKEKNQAMNETSKAMRRRRCEEASGGFKWSEVFKGKGVDVGAGNDPIQLPNCRPFDMYDGDANFLNRYVPNGSVDYVHASQCLEHMVDPRAALLNWALCVKKGGHIVWSTPCFDAYEKRQFPSRFNPDHKSAWSMWRRAHATAPMIHVPTFCQEMEGHGLKTILVRFVDAGFDYTLPDDIDQTLPADGAECFIECVMRKV